MNFIMVSRVLSATVFFLSVVGNKAPPSPPAGGGVLPLLGAGLGAAGFSFDWLAGAPPAGLVYPYFSASFSTRARSALNLFLAVSEDLATSRLTKSSSSIL